MGVGATVKVTVTVAVVVAHGEAVPVPLVEDTPESDAEAVKETDGDALRDATPAGEPLLLTEPVSDALYVDEGEETSEAVGTADSVGVALAVTEAEAVGHMDGEAAAEPDCPADAEGRTVKVAQPVGE